MSEGIIREWVDTPLDIEEFDPHGIVEISVEFEGKRSSHPRSTSASAPTASTRRPATSTFSPIAS